MNYDKRTIARIARAAKTLLLGAFVAMTSACDDFLTITPTDKVVLADFWKNKDDVESVMAQSYRLMAQKDFTYRLLTWGEMRSDNVREGNNTPTDIKNILNASILPSNSYASWAIFYEAINNCNLVLKYAPGVLTEDPNFTQGDLDVVRGEMLAVRALCHFYLVRTFRDIPLLTEAMVDNSQNLYQAQVTPIQALDQCLADLYEAEQLVLTSGNHYYNPKGGTTDRNNKGRFTKDAVRTMIADVLLWKAAFISYNAKGDRALAQACIDECISYCDLVLDTRSAYIRTMMKDKNTMLKDVRLNSIYPYPIVYPLESCYKVKDNNYTRFPHKPYDYLFANGGNHLYESIFEIQHSPSDGTSSQNYEVPYFYGCATDEAFMKFTPGVLSATQYLAVEGRLYKRTDFRRVNYILSESGSVDKYKIIKYGHSNAAESRNTDTDKYVFGKMSYKFFPNKGGYFSAENQVNWIIYRISDVMLMKAEALSLRGAGADLEEAFKLVKAIYDRSQTFYYYEYEGDLELDGPGEAAKDEIAEKTDSEGMLKLVLEERQREFAFEGKRWFDLVRYALFTSVDGTTDKLFSDTNMLAYKYASNKEQYGAKMGTISSLFYPIAEREMNTNPLLVQNEAYKTQDKYEKN